MIDFLIEERISRTSFCVKASLICLLLFLSFIYGCCLVSLRCYNCIGQPLCNEEPGGIGGCQFLQPVFIKLVGFWTSNCTLVRFLLCLKLKIKSIKQINLI